MPVGSGTEEFHSDIYGEGGAKRPLHSADPVYPVILIDCGHVKVRDGQVANRPIHLALAVTVDGAHILCLWAGDGGEGAKYWLQAVTQTCVGRLIRALFRSAGRQD